MTPKGQCREHTGAKTVHQKESRRSEEALARHLLENSQETVAVALASEARVALHYDSHRVDTL